MLWKQLLEIYDLLDTASASGEAVCEYLRSIDPQAQVETYPLYGKMTREGVPGKTDMLRLLIPERRGNLREAARPPSVCLAGWAALAPDPIRSALSRTATAPFARWRWRRSFWI